MFAHQQHQQHQSNQRHSVTRQHWALLLCIMRPFCHTALFIPAGADCLIHQEAFINFNNKSKYTRKHTWGNEGGAALLLFKEGIQLQKICWNMNIITSNRGDKNVQYRNKNQFSHNINLLFLPHKTSSQCHHSDCTFCSLPWIYDTWQTDLCCASERWVNPSAGACSIHCTPGYNIQIKLMQFLPF